jgi:predicted transcriptional regulator
MATTVQISEELRDTLAQRKLYEKETYEEVIRDLLEDSMELSDETKKEIEQARKEIAAGKYYTMEEIKKEFGL